MTSSMVEAATTSSVVGLETIYYLADLVTTKYTVAKAMIQHMPILVMTKYSGEEVSM